MVEISRQSEIPEDASAWAEVLNRACVARQPELLELADRAVKECPRDFRVLYLASVAALLEQHPTRCLRYLQRIEKYFVPNQQDLLLRAVARAQQGVPAGGYKLLHDAGLTSLQHALYWFVADRSLLPWMQKWLQVIFASAVSVNAKPGHAAHGRPCVLSNRRNRKKTKKANRTRSLPPWCCPHCLSCRVIQRRSPFASK